MTHDGSQTLWAEVLSVAIADALHGWSGAHRNPTSKLRAIEDARAYLIEPNDDFDAVCTCAGIDPEAARERIRTMIAVAPTPEEIVKGGRKRKGNRRNMRKQTRRRRADVRAGVVADFARSDGTGGGRSAQDSPKIDFPHRRARA